LKHDNDMYMGCAYGIESPEFMDVVMLQLVGYVAAPCLSIPSLSSSRSKQEPITNLDGTPLIVKGQATPIRAFEQWCKYQDCFLNKNECSTKALTGNYEAAMEFLLTQSDANTPSSPAEVAARIIQAMIFSLSGKDFGVFTIHGEKPDDANTASSSINDLTILALERLALCLNNSLTLRVAGPSGILLRKKNGVNQLTRDSKVSCRIIELALDSKACLVGPARFLLTDQIGKHINIPWYLRPSQLLTTKQCDYDIKLTQVSSPFWCRWGDPKGLAEEMIGLSRYSLWETPAMPLMKVNDNQNAFTSRFYSPHVLDALRRWLFGRRASLRPLRFADASRHIKSIINPLGLEQLVLQLHEAGLVSTVGVDRFLDRVNESALVARMANFLLNLGELSLPRTFCFAEPQEVLRIAAPLLSQSSRKTSLPHLFLRVNQA